MEGTDLVFALDMGLGRRLKVFVSGPPEAYSVSLMDSDRDAFISIDKCDWERIVECVSNQFN